MHMDLLYDLNTCRDIESMQTSIRQCFPFHYEEEEERSDRWTSFLERQAVSNEECSISLSGEINGNEQNNRMTYEGPVGKEVKTHKIQIWSKIRPSLASIEQMMSSRVKSRKGWINDIENRRTNGAHLASIEEAKQSEDSDDEFYDVERSDPNQEVTSADSTKASSSGTMASQSAAPEPFSPWKEEFECLVRDGLPMALRGELWQAFVGIGTRRVEGYYNNLLNMESDFGNSKFAEGSTLDDANNGSKVLNECVTEKWKGQIEKDLPRTFPGHPALDEDGRNALRRLLTAYARHNPSVGYCQAMNFFAGLLLLLMPEENAFWTLTGIIDDYFDGYYSEEMIESQVDQLVLEELVRERFPKLVNHLDYLGVQVAWVTGPWFLSIFVNMLPWESVLRVWDVLLFEGNRVMLFRTALALMELYGPALVTTKDAGDAVTLLQSLSGSTFDSSQLVLTACMGYQAVNENRLQDLGNKHRPAVLAAMEERSKGLRAWRDSQGLASKFYGFKNGPGSLLTEANPTEGSDDRHTNGNPHLVKSDSSKIEGFLSKIATDADSASEPDLKEQVTWLKVELCRLLEEKRSAVLRAEELETALIEMVKQDNRRLLSAKVEELEQEKSELQQALKDKQEQEHAMLQILMRVEQEQRVTEDARIYAEQEAAAQKNSAHVFQEKYEEAMSLFAQMEERAIMAETMLEATLQYQSSQVKAHSPRTSSAGNHHLRPNQDPSQDFPTRKTGLLLRPFALGWRDKNKGKPGNLDESVEAKISNGGGQDLQAPPIRDMNGHQNVEK
ncbi:uncharacterized protein A4U43_C02F2180 [Asparagus officinalis]|uniref:Rab-GAP TBC domain-containing protein n=1 Tax=Asparagus officinalis TaxID=4686 RepID=A0A5P1FKA6_ASPOF|nr:uncharacterized protein A4U43_C02F2180 [Asparagus officinalis]